MEFAVATTLCDSREFREQSNLCESYESGSWDFAEAGGGFGRVCWRWEVRAGGSGQKKKEERK